MDFLFGIIIGLLIAILVFVILGFFRSSIEKTAKIAQTRLGNVGPRPKGAVFIPADDAKLSRDEIIAKNKADGKDTPIEDLR